MVHSACMLRELRGQLRYSQYAQTIHVYYYGYWQYVYAYIGYRTPLQQTGGGIVYIYVRTKSVYTE